MEVDVTWLLVFHAVIIFGLIGIELIVGLIYKT